jgi:hypothetical protein
MHTFALFCSMVLALGMISATYARGEEHSHLWGTDGEQWDPAGRMTDYSFAGYRRGETPIPDVPVAANIRDFGARGDGEHDDTDPFKRAIAETEAGAILIPPGRYVISDILDIRKPNLVLRGAGPDQTTLVFTTALEDVRPNMGATTGGQPTSNYSWSGGFIWVRGDYQGTALAQVTAPARRGDTTLTVSSPDGLEIGQEIELRQEDEDQNTLAEHLYAGQPGDMSNLNGRIRASLTTRIVAIDDNQITLDRPLPFDVHSRWRPQILRFEPTVSEVGIEGIGFEFPAIPYAGHFTERGHNAIAMQQVANCWVRDMVIDNCDSGIFVSGRFCTLQDIVFNSERSPDSNGNRGHHGITLGGQDNLLTRFRYNFKFIHDITVTAGSAGNVASSGSGVDLCFDHHKRAPNNNLFTDIDAGEGTRLWRSGGGAALGRHCAAWTTFWNIRTQRPQDLPPQGFATDMINLVGLRSEFPPIRDRDGKWFEPAGDGDILPVDLHEAQLNRRLNAEP